MAKIDEYIALIRNAIYGREVRSAIANGIEQCYVDNQGAVDDAVERANTAASNATTATQNANEKATAANNAATNANEKAGLANSAATNANEKAGLANSAATNANEKATAANNAAQLANEAADDANAASAKIDNMTVKANVLPAGSAPTATVSDVSGHKHIAFGIPRGNTGTTPNMSIGTVETLNPDQQAGATITGTPEAPVLNLRIPKGNTGSIDNVYGSTIPVSESDSRSIKQVLDTKLESVPVMGGASTSSAGASGLVPAPAAGNATRYLRSDGTWTVPPDTHVAVDSALSKTSTNPVRNSVVTAKIEEIVANTVRGNMTVEQVKAL